MNNRHLRSLSTLGMTGIALAFLLVAPAQAADAATIHLKIQAVDTVVYDANLEVAPCETFTSSSVYTVSGRCAVLQSGLPSEWIYDDSFLNSLAGYVNNTDNNGIYWSWFANGEYGLTALNQHELTAGENLLLTYNASPLALEASDQNPLVNTTTTISVKQFGLDASWNPVWNVSPNSTVIVNGAKYPSETGVYELYITTATPYIVTAKKSGGVDSPAITITPRLPSQTVKLQIETASGTLYNQNLTVSACETKPGNGIYTVNGYCALQQSGLVSSWTWWGDDAFLDTLGGQVNNADNNGVYWNWFSGLTYGQTALNKHELAADETLLLTYNKNPLRLSAATTTPNLNATTTVTLEQFGFSGWDPVWQTAVSGTIAVNGEENFTASGAYDLFIATTSPYTIYGKKDGFIDSAAATITGQQNDSDDNGNGNGGDGESGGEQGNGGNGGGGGGGGGGTNYQKINVGQALTWLTSQQTDGNFGSNVLTDWAAVAFAADGTNPTKETIKNYLIANTDSSGGLNSVSDNARRALALMSLGINPYTGTTVNYIKKITDTFDGTQFGDAELYNDDIFAVLILLKSGYSANDAMTASDINFVLSKQDVNGSWGSVDLTAAAVQALESAGGVSNVNAAITRAKNYLKTNQNSDGSFAGPTPSMSTAWGVQALLDSGDNTARGNNYLYARQTNDGGLEDGADLSTRVWATAYAVPAALQKSWTGIMQSFSKPSSENNAGNGDEGGVNYPPAIPIVTSTIVSTTTITTSTTTTISDGTEGRGGRSDEHSHSRNNGHNHRN